MAQGVNQGAANAQAASDNWNSLSTLSSLSSIAGMVQGGAFNFGSTNSSTANKNGMTSGSTVAGAQNQGGHYNYTGGGGW